MQTANWYGALCDMRGCVTKAEVRVDERLLCWACLELLLERLNAIGEYPAMREMLDPLPFR